jgi:hypothetical protein
VVRSTTARTLSPRIAIHATRGHALAPALARHRVPVRVLRHLALEPLLHILPLLALTLARLIVEPAQAGHGGGVPARAAALHVLLQQQVLHLLLRVPPRQLGLDDHVDTFLPHDSGATFHRGGRAVVAFALAAHQVDQVGLFVAEQVDKELTAHVRKGDLYGSAREAAGMVL